MHRKDTTFLHITKNADCKKSINCGISLWGVTKLPVLLAF